VSHQLAAAPVHVWPDMSPSSREPSTHVMQVVYDLVPGGSESLALAIARAGTSRGLRMSVCGLGHRRTLATPLNTPGVATHSMNRRLGLQPTLVGRLYRLFRREGVTVVVSHHLGQLLYAGPAARLAGARLVHVEHEFYTLQPAWDRRLLQAASKLVERVVAVSDEVADFLVARVGVPQRKVVVIRNGVDVARFAPSVTSARHELGIPLDVPVLGTVGRLDPAKDQLTLLQSFRLIRDVVPSIHLVIVGDGPARAELERYVNEHGLDGRVHLLGARLDIPHLLPGMDVFALSSIHEGLPLAMLEAMACERPVVTTNVGAAGTVIRRAGAGFVVEPKDPAALARNVIALLRDRPLARRLGAMGRAAVETQYNLATTVDSYLALCGLGDA